MPSNATTRVGASWQASSEQALFLGDPISRQNRHWGVSNTNSKVYARIRFCSPAAVEHVYLGPVRTRNHTRRLELEDD